MNNLNFEKEDVMYYIDNGRVVVAVLDEIEDTLFGVSVFPVKGRAWSKPNKEVVKAYKNGSIDFSKECELV